jgi:hypothetical protein
VPREPWAFPFFGQGDAGYYEWFELWVWFVDPVAPKLRKRVLADAPRLCTLDAQCPHPTLLWASTGDQWIHQHLVEEYGTKAAKKRMAKAAAHHEAVLDGKAEDDDEDYLDDLLALGGETAKFNTDIERWLIALHARQPILFVARRQDTEAGGTKLGAWHEWSVATYPERVQGALAALKKLGKDDLRRTPIALVLDYVGAKNVTKPKPPPESKAYRAIEREIVALHAAKAAKWAPKLTSQLEYVKALGAVYERVLMWGLAFDDDCSRLAWALGKGAFGTGAYADHERLCVATDDYMLTDATASLYYVALAGAQRHADRALFAALRDELRTRSPGSRRAHPRLLYGKLGVLGTPLDKLAMELEHLDAAGLEDAAHARLESDDFAAALELSERAAAYGKPSWRLVSNAIAMALYAHPKRFPRALLDRWMKRAPKRGTNGGYWENVACAQVKLGRHEAAIASLRKAIAAGYDRDALAKDDMLAPLRKLPEYEALVQKPRKRSRSAVTS